MTKEKIKETDIQEVKQELDTEILPSKVVLKQIKRNSWLPTNHDGSFRFNKAVERLVPQFLIKNGVYNTGLSPEDESRLEKKIGLVTGTLNKSNVEYWAFKLFINIPKEGVILFPASNYIDELKYRVLLVHKEVANSINEYNEGKFPFANYVMTSEEEEVIQINKKLNLKLEAFGLFAKMTEAELFDFLTAYGKPVSKDSSLDFVKAKTGEIVELDPKAFITIVKGKDYKMTVFIKKCVRAGILRETGGKYIRQGGDVIGYSLGQVIDFLSNPENQEIYIMMKSQLESMN